MQRTTSSHSSASRRTRATGNGLLVTLHPVVLPVPRHCSSSTPSTMPVPVSRTTPSRPRVEEPGSSTVSSMYTRRPSLPTVSLVFTVDSSRLSSVSSSTVVFSEFRFMRFLNGSYLTINEALVSTTPLVRQRPFFQFHSILHLYRACCSHWCSPGQLLRLLLARLGSYYWSWSCFLPSRHYQVRALRLYLPHRFIWNRRRRMMMTSGGGVHYKSMFDAGSQVVILQFSFKKLC